METRQRIFGLDLMRAIAIAMVLGAQCIWIFPQTNGIVLQIASLFNYIGREIFFVLCGFLLGNTFYKIYLNEDFQWKSVVAFLKMRALQILPLYFVILTVNFLIAFSIGYPVDQGWKYCFALQNFASAMPVFFPESWGLPIIFFSTALFPVIVFLLQYTFRPKDKSLLFVLAAFLLLFVFLISKAIYNLNTHHTDISQWDSALKAVVIYRCDSVFIGVLFSWLGNKHESFFRAAKVPFAFIGVLGIGFIFAGVGYFHLLIANYKFFWNVCYLPLTSFAIALFIPLLNDWKNIPQFLGGPIALLSKYTYAIYMVHFGVVFQLMKYYFPDSGSLWFVVVYLLLTFSLGIAIYHFLLKKSFACFNNRRKYGNLYK